MSRALSERLERARRAVSEALEAIGAPLPFSDAGFGSSGEAGSLQAIQIFLEATHSPASQKEVLTALLEAASGQAARAILFIVRADTLNAWAVRSNPSEDAGTETRGAHMTLPARGDHLPARAVAAGRTCVAGAEGPGFVMTEWLGGPIPAHSVSVPIAARGRVVALLYGDIGGMRGPSPEPILTILGRLCGLVLEAYSASRRGRAATTAAPATVRRLRVEVGVARPAAAGRWDSDAGRPAENAAGQEAGGFWDEPESPEASVAVPAVIAPPEDAEMQALLSDFDGMRHSVGNGGLSPEDQRLLADARRFASLLISEILLYNEEAVIQGRRHRDLARRLEKEIAKSRQAFAARLPAQLRSASRYFEDELVRVLAEGDAAAIGA